MHIGCSLLLCSLLGGQVRVYGGERRHDFLVRPRRGSIGCEWCGHALPLYASGRMVRNSQLSDRHVQPLAVCGHVLGLILGGKERDRHHSPHPLRAWSQLRCGKLLV